MSRPVRGAWIETARGRFSGRRSIRRAPYGARGLKHRQLPHLGDAGMSRPVRGAWIETLDPRIAGLSAQSRPVRGAWIETWRACIWASVIHRRAPYGARGLKPLPAAHLAESVKSRPVRGAWIETLRPPTPRYAPPSRAPYGARGLKHGEHERGRGRGASRPVRGAWIETKTERRRLSRLAVAPRTGRVD